MAILRVELVSPERIAYSGEAKMIIARTIEGDIAFLPGHVPFIGVLDTHVARVLLDEGGEQTIAVHQGFVEVSPADDNGDTLVTILSDVCELGGDIDIDRAERARVAAEEAIRSDAADVVAVAALRRAEARLAAAA